MTFVEMRDRLIEHFEEMTENINHLFVMQVDKDEMWETYLNSFPNGSNPIFRVNREYDCSCCRGFIKNVGNVVALKDGKIETIWDFECDDTVYSQVVHAMKQYVLAHQIIDKRTA